MVWWLRLRAFDAGGTGSIPGAGLGGGGGLGSHLPWAWPEKKKKRERTGMVFERGRWNHEDEEPAVLEEVWQALQITRGASSAIILEKSYFFTSFFHSESSLAPGIHFSTDMLKEGAWKALRGRMALPLQKGWLRIPQSPHEGPGTTARSAPSLRLGGFLLWPGAGQFVPLSFPASNCSLEWPEVSENILLLCLEPASSSPRHLSSPGKV